jgi:hypothetical protein
MVPRILWLALFASQGIYLVLVTVPGLLDRPTEPSELVALPVLAGVAVMMAVMSFVLPAVMRNAAARSVAPATTEGPAAAVSASYRGPIGSTKTFADRTAALRDGVRVGTAPFIVGLALTESVAVIGLVLAFMGHPRLHYLPFFAVAALLMLARFPTEHTFLAPIERAHGISN